MSAAVLLYSILGGLGLIYLIFILTPTGKRWLRSLDK